MVRARVTHALMLGLMAYKAMRQPLPAGSRRRGLAIVAAGALAAEYSLRKGTARELPVGQMRARMRRTRARAGARATQLRGNAARGLASARASGARVPGTTVAVSAAVLLAAVAIASGPGKSRTPAAPPAPSAPIKTPVKAPVKAPTPPQRPAAKPKAAPVRPAALKAPRRAKEPRAPRKGLDKVAGPALRPSLLLAAVAGCDLATGDHSVLRRIAPEKREALRQRAPAVRVPERVSTSGGHVKRVAAGAWRRLGKAMAMVPPSARPWRTSCLHSRGSESVGMPLHV